MVCLDCGEEMASDWERMEIVQTSEIEMRKAFKSGEGKVVTVDRRDGEVYVGGCVLSGTAVAAPERKVCTVEVTVSLAVLVWGGSLLAGTLLGILMDHYFLK